MAIKVVLARLILDIMKGSVEWLPNTVLMYMYKKYEYWHESYDMLDAENNLFIQRHWEN